MASDDHHSKILSLQAGTIVAEKYQLVKQIAENPFEELWTGKSIATNNDVMLKMERLTDNPMPTLHHELHCFKKILKHYEGSERPQGIPRIYFYHQDPAHGFRCLVMEHLGKSLSQLFQEKGKRFSLKTVMQLAIQMISRVETLHDAKIVHRDLMPGHFLIGHPPNDKTIYVVDLKWAKDETEDNAVELKSNSPGATLFMSIDAHLNEKLHHKHDLEQIGYILVYLAKGTLPWESVDDADAGNELRIQSLKQETTADDLCSELPSCFRTYMRYVYDLTADDQPDYSGLREKFRKQMAKKGFPDDGLFDWNEN